MQQRPSIDVPVVLDKDLSIFMLNHMMESGLAETPLMFVDKQNLCQVIDSAEPQKAPNPPIVPVDSETFASLTEAMGHLTAMGLEAPVGALVAFANGSNVVVVGSESHFYFIDLAHGLFHYTAGPEYDIAAYAAQYGDDKPAKIQFYIVEEKKPAPKKRVKKNEKKQEAAAE